MDNRPLSRFFSVRSWLLVGLTAFAVAGTPFYGASTARPSGESEAARVAREFRFVLEQSGGAGSKQIALVLRPQTPSGQMLANCCSAVVWIETAAGDLAGIEQLRLITRLAECRIECAAEELPAKSVVRGRLVGPSGETLTDFQSPIL